MPGASIEATLELWASSLREVKRRMRQLFAQDRAAINAGLFLDGLLGNERRKTGWMRAEAAGDPGPWRQQALLGRDRWDADALRDMVREYVIEHLADDDAVLVVDETGFLKQGKSLRRCTAVHGVGREDHELPDRRVRCLCVAPRACFHRSSALLTEKLDR
jgi:SRSO17 transposase